MPSPSINKWVKWKGWWCGCSSYVCASPGCLIKSSELTYCKGRDTFSIHVTRKQIHWDLVSDEWSDKDWELRCLMPELLLIRVAQSLDPKNARHQAGDRPRQWITGMVYVACFWFGLVWFGPSLTLLTESCCMTSCLSFKRWGYRCASSHQIQNELACFTFIYLFTYWRKGCSMCQGGCVEVRGQLVRSLFLSLYYVGHRWNSVLKDWWHSP